MKIKFTSFDVACVVAELKKTIQGLRVINVYDIDNKSYIVKLGQEVKTMLYIESGSRMHITAFDWPKQLMPSAFSAKCRKLMKNKRLTNVTQIGCDRIIDLQFGHNEYTSHLIIELYDKGNVCLCDHQYVITAILRTRQDSKEDLRYAVGHFYPIDICQRLEVPSSEFIKSNIEHIKPNTQLKRWLNFMFPVSTPLIEHHLIEVGMAADMKVTEGNILDSLDIISAATLQAFNSFNSLPSTIENGFIFYKNIKNSSLMDEFHPIKFHQLESSECKEFASYNESIDFYFYQQETQKIEMKSIQQERNVIKKLENIKNDHENRIKALQEIQEASTHKAYLIEVNLDLVNEAIKTVQNLIANRLSWEEIAELVKEGKENNHQAALAIKNVNLESNMMIMALPDPYSESFALVDIGINLDMGAYNNAKNYFDQVKQSSVKEQKTIQSSSVALKNAEKHTDATIKDINIVASIKKARRLLWFEKFLWFITSDGYIVIGGRDAQQNEILVKKYLKKNDAYVHADIHGATSIIVKNNSNNPLPPKALMEAGCFGLCHSSAWNSKIVTSAYWVHAEQVSKTAPSGEYLTTGSFMIRGKKNYLPPTQLILGFSVLFKIDEDSVQRRLQEEKDKNLLVSSTVEKDELPTNEGINEFPTPYSEIPPEVSLPNPGTFDNIFEKYNLQISAVPKNEQDFTTAEFTDLVGTASKPRFKKQSHNTLNERKDTEVKESKKPKRGQKGKKKKLEKYTDQSDDERDAIMALLGSAGTKKDKSKTNTANSKHKYKAESTAKNVVSHIVDKEDNSKLKEADRVMLSLSKTADDIVSIEHNVTNSVKPIEELIEPKIVLSTEPLNSESNLDQNTSDNEDEILDVLDSLVLNPATEDSILFGIPFVAPYSATSSCKFRVKLIPGATKKGKACKTIIDLFSRDKNALMQEKNVFKSLKDVDMTTNIPGKVKVSAPNLHGHSKK